MLKKPFLARGSYLWCATGIDPWPSNFSFICKWHVQLCWLWPPSVCWWLLPNIYGTWFKINRSKLKQILCVTGSLKINWAFILVRIKQNLLFLVHKKRLKNLYQLDIRRGDIKIKQHTSVIYLGCELDQYLSGESMVTKVLGK